MNLRRPIHSECQPEHLRPLIINFARGPSRFLSLKGSEIQEQISQQSDYELSILSSMSRLYVFSTESYVKFQ